MFFKAEELLESLTTVPECQRENPIHLVIADSCCPSTDFATGLQGSFNLQYLYIYIVSQTIAGIGSLHLQSTCRLDNFVKARLMVQLFDVISTRIHK